MDKQALEEIIKSLKEKFKREGIVTYDDVNALLSAGNVDPNEIDDILSALAGLGIEVKKPVQEYKSLGEKIDNEIKRLIKVGKAHGHLTYDEVGEKLAVECEANAEQMEEVFKILAENDIQIINNTLDLVHDDIDQILSEVSIDDPVKVYLKDIGKVSLLTVEEELELAHRMSKGDEEAKKTFKRSKSQIGGFHSQAPCGKRHAVS